MSFPFSWWSNAGEMMSSNSCGRSPNFQLIFAELMFILLGFLVVFAFPFILTLFLVLNKVNVYLHLFNIYNGDFRR